MKNTLFQKLLIIITSTVLLFGCSEEDVLSPQSGGATTGTGTSTALVNTLIGSSTGSNFKEGVLEIKLNNVETNGSTVVSAYIVNSTSLNLSGQSHTVAFTSDCAAQFQASFSATSVITTTGIATTTYIDQGCQLKDFITATVKVGGVDIAASGSVAINSSTTPTITTVRIGTGSGTSFSNGILTVAPNAISAGGTTAISVNLVDDAGDLLSTDQTVTFGSTCVNNLLANLSATNVPTSNGTASTTYTSVGCSNTDEITASVTANGTTIYATGSLSIAQPDAGSIQFTSVSSALIALQSTGSTTGLPETSNIIFSVLDGIGTPISGEDVTFSLDSDVGGITLATSTATSNINGEVVATVQSGTVATSVRVTAVLDSNTNLITTSSAIVIATGPPDQDSMTLSAETLNPRAWNWNGNEVAITVQLADRFNNRIQDGTAVSFVTELGAIDPSCATVNGTCTVNWVSQSPKYNPNVINNVGRTTILATVEGEESFDDTNSNGVFDNNDIGFDDREEAFMDENEDGLYNDLATDDELYIDFDSSGSHNVPNGLYNGSGCTHTTKCDTTSESITVRDDVVLVMAEDNPHVYAVYYGSTQVCDSIESPPAAADADLLPNCMTSILPTATLSSAAYPITFEIAGAINGQILPVGSEIIFEATGAKVVAGPSHTIPNTNADASLDPGFIRYTAFIEPATDPTPQGVLKVSAEIAGTTHTFTPISLSVAAAPTYAVSGNLTGTAISTGSLSLLNNGGDAYLMNSTTATTFAFDTKLLDADDYAVTVVSNTTGLTCTVSGGDSADGSGAIKAAVVTDIVVNCL